MKSLLNIKRARYFPVQPRCRLVWWASLVSYTKTCLHPYQCCQLFPEDTQRCDSHLPSVSWFHVSVDTVYAYVWRRPSPHPPIAWESQGPCQGHCLWVHSVPTPGFLSSVWQGFGECGAQISSQVALLIPRVPQIPLEQPCRSLNSPLIGG